MFCCQIRLSVSVNDNAALSLASLRNVLIVVFEFEVFYSVLLKFCFLQIVAEKRSGGRDYGLVSNYLPAGFEEIGFDFRKQRFTYSKELKKFCKLDYPTKETFGTYAKSTGHGSEAKALSATEKWGKNMYVSYLELGVFFLRFEVLAWFRGSPEVAFSVFCTF